MRQTGTGVCMAFGRLGSIFAPIIYEACKASWGGTLPYMALTSTLAVVGAFYSMHLTVETKGRPLADFGAEEMRTVEANPNDPDTHDIQEELLPGRHDKFSVVA